MSLVNVYHAGEDLELSERGLNLVIHSYICLIYRYLSILQTSKITSQSILRLCTKDLSKLTLFKEGCSGCYPSEGIGCYILQSIEMTLNQELVGFMLFYVNSYSYLFFYISGGVLWREKAIALALP